MSGITRLLLVIVPCFAFLFNAALPAAHAATSYQSYWSKYYSQGLYGNWYKAQVSQPAAPAPAPQPPAPATPAPDPQPTTPSTPAPAPSPAPSTSGLTADESLMLNLVNQERVKAGLPEYSVDMKLVQLARQKSQDMYQNNYFDHTSPTYGSPYEMEKKAGYSARVMGAENIAKAATTERAHTLLMNSSGHRANILNPLHTLIGIGIVNTSGGVIVTQLFAGN